MGIFLIKFLTQSVWSAQKSYNEDFKLRDEKSYSSNEN